MSLAIEVDDVVAVLLADGWHEVYADSFEIDAYEYTCGPEVLLGGGQCALVPSAGATWSEVTGERVYTPLTAVLAVKTKRRKKA